MKFQSTKAVAGSSVLALALMCSVAGGDRPPAKQPPVPVVPTILVLPSGPFVDFESLAATLGAADANVMDEFSRKRLPTTNEVAAETTFSDVIRKLSGRRVVVIEPGAIRDAFGDTTYAKKRSFWAPEERMTMRDMVEGFLGTEYIAGDPATGLQRRRNPDLREAESIRLVPTAIITKDYIIVVPLPMPHKLDWPGHK